jgi:biofilm protein TabA
MIVDRMEHLGLYRGMSPQLDVAIAFAEKQGAALRGDAPVDLLDGAGYAFSTSYATEPEEERRYEVHRRYIDLQIMQEGEETCLVTDLAQFPDRDEYQEPDDLQFLNGEPAEHVRFKLLPGTFAIFFPHDAHKPACSVPGCDRVTKCVIKIAV